MTLKSADQIPVEDQPVIFQEVRDSLAFIRQHYELEGCLDASFYDAFAGYLYCLNLKKEFNFCTIPSGTDDLDENWFADSQICVFIRSVL